MSESPPSINPANTGDLPGVLREMLKKFLMGIDGKLPARIVSYDRPSNRAVIQPMIALVTTDGKTISRNQLVNIPVLNIGGGGFILSFPLKKGDLGWIEATDRDLADFLKTYKESAPATKRIHDFNSGLFVPDVMTGYNISDDGAVIQNIDGTVKVVLFDDKLELTAPTIDANGDTVNVTATNVNLVGKTALGGIGGQPIARVGDAVSGGVITAGSTEHTAT